MVRRRYIGVTDPASTFGSFRPLRRELCDLRLKCTPLGEDWQAIDGMIKALDGAARHFTGQDDFFGGRAPDHSSW